MHIFSQGKSVLSLLTVFALAAVVGLTAWQSTQKTNLINKAATNCNTISSSATCDKTPGCESQYVVCDIFSPENCPSSLSTDCYVPAKVCAGKTEEECKSVPSSGCKPTYTVAYCKAFRLANEAECKTYTTPRQCSNHNNKCTWSRSVYTGCGGDNSCIGNGGDVCTSCSQLCTTNKTSCLDSTHLQTCSANGCYQTVTKCPTKCLPADNRYHLTDYCQ